MNTPIASKLQITHNFKNIESSQPVKEYAEKRASKFAKHMHHMTHAHFSYSKSKTGFICELHIVAGDFEANADSSGETLYTAIDLVVDKALQQSRKHKDKLTDRSGQQRADFSDTAEIDESPEKAS